MTINNSSNIPSVINTLVRGTGTGFTTVPLAIAPAASTVAEWDANSNISANSFIGGYTTTATAAGTTTLTVASDQTQFFTGATTQTVVMPVTSTLVLGQSFVIVNNSSGIVTVQSSGANLIQAMLSGTQLALTVVDTGVTTAAGWNKVYLNTAGSGSVQIAVQSFTADDTYTPTAGMKFCTIEVVGGGGGGGGAAGSLVATVASAAGGGGGGGYARLSASAATVGASQAVSVGVGGFGGIAGAFDGGLGGQSSVGSLCVATGGIGSVSTPSTGAITAWPGGAGGAGTAGDILVIGSNGSAGLSSGPLAFAVSGAGGSSYFAGASSVVSGIANGLIGNIKGGGASGASTFGINGDYVGGAGGDGFVVITEYI